MTNGSRGGREAVLRFYGYFLDWLSLLCTYPIAVLARGDLRVQALAVGFAVAGLLLITRTYKAGRRGR